MGQGYDSDRPQTQHGAPIRLPPVAPPPRKVSQHDSSAPPRNSFGPLPPVAAPPARRMPSASPPVPRIVPPASVRDALADSITRVKGGVPAGPDTYRDQSMENAVTNPNADARNSYDWDEEEESTHVFASSAPPPMLSASYGMNGDYRRESPQEQARIATTRGLGPSPDVLQGPPSVDTMRLDGVGSSPHAAPPPSNAPVAASTSSIPPRVPGQSGLSANPMFPPPPPIPSITQARPMETSVPGISFTNGQSPYLQNGGSTQAMPGAASLGQQMVGQVTGGAQEVVRDNQPYTRLPAGNPQSPTELAIRKPTLPSSYVPPATLAVDALPAGTFQAAPRRDPKKWILAAAAFAALVSLVALITFLFARRPGGVQIEVKDASGASVPKAEVYIDGRKVCEATPCSVRDLDVGKHAIRVMTPSQESVEPMNVDVQAGSMTPVVFTLKPSVGTLVASTDQKDVHLWVDGVDRGALPAKVGDLTPGKHDIKLTGDRFKTFEKSVELAAGQTLDLEVPKLVVTKGRATVTVKTEGVAITLERADGQRSAPKALEGPFPRTIEVDTTTAWKLVAKKKGLPDFVAALDFPDGMSERTIEVDLKDPKAVVEPPPVASSAPPTTTTAPPPVAVAPVRPTPSPTPDPPKKPDAPAADPPASGTGFLNINSIPASRVLLDGAPLGETPKSGVVVSAGTHTVTFIHPELGKKSVSVKVGPGETKTASARLRAD